MKTNKAVVAATAGLVGVLALGACSSGASDQAQDASSATQSASQGVDREADKADQADNSNNVAVPGSKGGEFDDVLLTHDPLALCTRTEKKNEYQKDALYIKCEGVNFNMIGDNVYVRVPEKNYKIVVENLSFDEGNGMTATLRDYAAVAMAQESGQRIVSWQDPTFKMANRGWAVGVDAREYVRIDIEIWVTRT